MAYRLLEGESIAEGVRRIGAEQIEKALHDIDGREDDLHEAVHEFRKRCKKIRGLIRLARPAFPSYSDENAWFRDRAAELSELRDATSMQECLEGLLLRYADDVAEDGFAEVREWLAERKHDIAAEADAHSRLARIGEELTEHAERVREWEFERLGFEDLAAGFAKTYRRARTGMYRAAAAPSAENFHEWRKRVKYYRYHARLLKSAWPPVIGGLHREARRLSDLLGDDHDLAVFHETLASEAGRIGEPAGHPVLLALLGQRSGELRAWSLTLGRRLFAEKPKRHARRMLSVLEAWQSERELSPLYPERSAEVFT